MKITKTERSALAPAIVFGWEVITNGRGVSHWDGDTTMPFRAHVTMRALIDKGLMERVAHARCEWFRATGLGKSFRCRAEGCFQGRHINGDDLEVGRCHVCEGTGVLLDNGEGK